MVNISVFDWKHFLSSTRTFTCVHFFFWPQKSPFCFCFLSVTMQMYQHQLNVNCVSIHFIISYNTRSDLSFTYILLDCHKSWQLQREITFKSILWKFHNLGCKTRVRLYSKTMPIIQQYLHYIELFIMILFGILLKPFVLNVLREEGVWEWGKASCGSLTWASVQQLNASSPLNPLNPHPNLMRFKRKK